MSMKVKSILNDFFQTLLIYTIFPSALKYCEIISP